MDIIAGCGPEGLSPTAEKMRRPHALRADVPVARPAFLPSRLSRPPSRHGLRSRPPQRHRYRPRPQGPRGPGRHDAEIRPGDHQGPTAGKKIHGTGAIPGGINKNLTPEERDSFLKGAAPLNIETMIEWAPGAPSIFFKSFHKKNKDLIDGFAPFPSNHLSLVRKDGALDFYHGVPEGRGQRRPESSRRRPITGTI